MEVEKEIDKLRSDTSIGIDRIPVEIWKTSQGTYILSFNTYNQPLYCNIKFSQTLEDSTNLPHY